MSWPLVLIIPTANCNLWLSMWGYPSLTCNLQYVDVKACGAWLGEIARLDGSLPPLPSRGLRGPSTWDFAVASCDFHLSMLLWSLLRLPSMLAFAALITLWLWSPFAITNTFTWHIVMAICRFARRHNQEEEEEAPPYLR